MARKRTPDNLERLMIATQMDPSMPMWVCVRGTYYPQGAMTPMGPEPITDSWSFRLNPDQTVAFSGDVPEAIRRVFA